ncbi:MAG: hypothetical protein MI745_10675 [Pseudomonadales bacterium]|nr:hypothetical protein [Pseudomonadales bacterium]
MESQTISGGVVHTLPEDLRQTLATDHAMLAQWQAIAPLARNANEPARPDGLLEPCRHGESGAYRLQASACKR